jgi:hypothetical protein
MPFSRWWTWRFDRPGRLCDGAVVDRTEGGPVRRILVAVVALAIAPAIGIFTSTPVTAATGHCTISGTAHADTLNGTRVMT